jgi:hypothetical protein
LDWDKYLESLFAPLSEEELEGVINDLENMANDFEASRLEFPTNTDEAGRPIYNTEFLENL